MTLTIPLKDTIVALHPFPSNLVHPFIFDFKPEHNFILDKTMVVQALAFAPHLSLNGLFGMVYEHISGCFILESPSSRFSELFQIVVVIIHGDIPRSMALVLKVNRLLTM